MTTVRNPSGDPFASRLLDALADHSERVTHQRSERELSPRPGHKGAIVETVIIGLAVNATWDFIKTFLRRAAEIPSTPADLHIEIDGTAVPIDRLAEHPDNDSDEQ